LEETLAARVGPVARRMLALLGAGCYYVVIYLHMRKQLWL